MLSKESNTKAIRLTGIAATWEKFRHGIERRRRFAMGCFSRWISSGQASDVDVRVQHNPDFVLSRLYGLTFRETVDGLRVSLCVRPGVDDVTNNALLALKCGYFGGLSLGYKIHKSATHRDKFGRFDLITEARFGEVSIVDQPLIHGTAIGFETWERPTEPTEPRKLVNQLRLNRFLREIDYQLAPAKPKKITKPATVEVVEDPPRKMTAEEFEKIKNLIRPSEFKPTAEQIAALQSRNLRHAKFPRFTH